MNFLSFQNILLSLLVILLLWGCKSADGDYPGSEYMPDMGHSLAMEANVMADYSLNTWDEKSTKSLKELSYPRKGLPGTVPRGFAGEYYGSYRSTNAEVLNPNGYVPYDYADTEEDRLRATAAIVENPFPIENVKMDKAKELYNIYCGVCHGEKGDGNGYLVRDDGGVYPAQPISFINEEFVAASNGRYYHAIMYGKNVMGGYKDKLSYEERWQVIHYIRSLQAKSLNLVYNEEKNTLNTVDIPLLNWSASENAHDVMEDDQDTHGDEHGTHESAEEHMH